MANSGPDVVNATLGAAFGGVWDLFWMAIEGLKFVCHCHKECKSLGEYLEMIKPMLEKISNQCQSEEAFKKWLDAFEKCLQKANEILEKCKDGSNWDRVREVRYGLQILGVKEEIQKYVNMSPMALLTHESINKTDVGTSVMMQEVPQEILGMEDHFKRVKLEIIEGQSENQSGRCVGIQGMGGSGKTLLAQMVNNDDEIQKHFGKDSIFWITVGRDASVSSLYVRMREYLRVQMSCNTHLEDQRTHLMNVFSNRRVLLILDDVWDDLYEHRKMVEWLNIARGCGSVTLFTTRNISILRHTDASAENLACLSKEHSWQLFCKHAFATNGLPSNQELMKLAKDVCNECKGLPLALKVIGGAMKTKDDIVEWRSTLQALRKSNASANKNVVGELFNRLRISYDQLDEPSKICFLYFAAYPEDMEIQTDELFALWVTEEVFGDDLDVEEALDKARCVLNELMTRSLVDTCKDYQGYECVKMHDILRDLAMDMTRKGEEVVRENLFKPGMNNVNQFPTAWLGKPLKVKRMSLVGQNINRFPNNFIAPELATCMIGASRRSFIFPLSIQECVIEEGFFESMANIRYMQLRLGANLRNVPSSIGTLRLLQHLELSKCGALKELPESIGGLGSLQHLDVSACGALEKLPESIGGLGSLQHLDVSSCGALEKLPESIGGLGSLQHLNMYYCEVLEKLPESIGKLGSLKQLDVSACFNLEKLPESIGGLGSLQHLNMSKCGSLEKLPESIGGLGSLQHLDMSACRALEKLPESIGGLGSLKHLHMSYCEALEKLPESIGGLGSLQHLDVSACGALEKLPESIGGLGSLQHLDVRVCGALEKLPESIGGLGSLQYLDMSYCRRLTKLPESIGGLGSLQHLNMNHCKALKNLPESIRGLGSLKHLDVSGCSNLEKFPESMGRLGSLQHLNMNYCEALKNLPESIGGLGSLQHLDMSACRALEKLPESIGGLGSLQYLKMRNCLALTKIPESIGELGSLQYLNMSTCVALTKLPESVGELRSLQYLDMNYCEALTKLPESIQGLGSLQHLNMIGLWALEKLPESIGGLGSLQHLDISECSALEKVPESIGGLGSLQHLDMSKCVALTKLPESVGGLGSLQRLYLCSCVALIELPDAIGALRSLELLDIENCEASKKLPSFTNNSRLRILY